MTKILRVKKGTCHIENCGRCPAGSSDGLSDMFLGRFTRCGFTAYVYDADRLPKYPMCPLDDLVEEKQAPAEQPPKVSRSAEYLDKEKVMEAIQGPLALLVYGVLVLLDLENGQANPLLTDVETLDWPGERVV